eukprot:354739-Chlamydomonas_euryale.AAC.1
MLVAVVVVRTLHRQICVRSHYVCKGACGTDGLVSECQSAWAEMQSRKVGQAAVDTCLRRGRRVFEQWWPLACMHACILHVCRNAPRLGASFGGSSTTTSNVWPSDATWACVQRCGGEGTELGDGALCAHVCAE